MTEYIKCNQVNQVCEGFVLLLQLFHKKKKTKSKGAFETRNQPAFEYGQKRGTL